MLRQTIAATKHEWAHTVLHDATNINDIWGWVAYRKGQRTNTFPALRSDNGSLVDSPEGKTEIFHKCFFPSHPKLCQIRQRTDLEPLPEREWEPINESKVDGALKGTSYKSAPGPSGVGYMILKWAHATHPDLLPHIFNLAMAEGVHPWHHATIVVLNKQGKPDYSIPKAY
jgi:hypothetical protein